LEARSVNRVGPALADRFEQYSQLPRVIFQIGVLRDDDVAGGAGDAAPQRRALATSGVRMDHPVAEPLVGQPVQAGAPRMVRGVGAARARPATTRGAPRG